MNMKTTPLAETAVDAAGVVPFQAGGGEDVSADALAAALDPVLVARLAAQARSQGVALLGRDGLLRITRLAVSRRSRIRNSFPMM